MPAEYELRLLRIAEEDFVEIISFIFQDSPAGAEKIATIIETSLTRLSNHPHLGRVPNEPELAGAGFRYLIVEDYLIFLYDRRSHNLYPTNSARCTRL